MTSSLFTQLAMPASTKIILLVLDGLGGLPRQPGGQTELESAFTPNLDGLASQSDCGLTIPVGPGITPGSGPGHLALFGYDPIEHAIGRGAMEALGVDFDLHPEDVAARGNFCTVDENGVLTDRRAGRLPTEQSIQLAGRLQEIRLDGVEFFIRPVKEHRFAFVARAAGLGDALTETDPLKTGVMPLPVRARCPESEKSALIINEFITQARLQLGGNQPANMILLRGFARLPCLPPFAQLYGLRAASIAIHGMYRGVSRLAGMQVLDTPGVTAADEIATLEKNWADFDFFYMHIKKTDTCGENGDFEAKVQAIEEVDRLIPRLMALGPDVLIVAGDHSTPSILGAHSWHPVPTLVHSRATRSNGITGFGESACLRGSLGIFPAKNLMPIALAHAGRLAKYGA